MAGSEEKGKRQRPKTDLERKKAEAVDEIYKAPQITRHPNSKMVPEGKLFRLQCRATGFPRPKYIWHHNGKKIDGARTDMLVIPKVRRQHIGLYTCVAENLAGKAESRGANLSILASKLIEAVTIKVEPVEIEYGQPYQLSAIVKGDINRDKLRFQWYLNDEKIKSANHSWLKIAQAKEKYQGRYHVVVSSPNAKVASEVIQLTFMEGLVAEPEVTSATKFIEVTDVHSDYLEDALPTNADFDIYMDPEHSRAIALPPGFAGDFDEFIEAEATRMNLKAPDPLNEIEEQSKRVAAPLPPLPGAAQAAEALDDELAPVSDTLANMKVEDVDLSSLENMQDLAEAEVMHGNDNQSSQEPENLEEADQNTVVQITETNDDSEVVLGANDLNSLEAQIPQTPEEDSSKTIVRLDSENSDEELMLEAANASSIVQQETLPETDGQTVVNLGDNNANQEMQLESGRHENTEDADQDNGADLAIEFTSTDLNKNMNGSSDEAQENQVIADAIEFTKSGLNQSISQNNNEAEAPDAFDLSADASASPLDSLAEIGERVDPDAEPTFDLSEFEAQSSEPNTELAEAALAEASPSDEQNASPIPDLPQPPLPKTISATEQAESPIPDLPESMNTENDLQFDTFQMGKLESEASLLKESETTDEIMAKITESNAADLESASDSEDVDIFAKPPEEAEQMATAAEFDNELPDVPGEEKTTGTEVNDIFWANIEDENTNTDFFFDPAEIKEEEAKAPAGEQEATASENDSEDYTPISAFQKMPSEDELFEHNGKEPEAEKSEPESAKLTAESENSDNQDPEELTKSLIIARHEEFELREAQLQAKREQQEKTQAELKAKLLAEVEAEDQGHILLLKQKQRLLEEMLERVSLHKRLG